MYNLKNRIYYAQLAHLDQYDLQRMISFVMIYGGLQLIALVAMSLMLNKRLRVSVSKQVPFVLENQWTLVHSKVILWFFYCVQNSLDHFGTSLARFIRAEVENVD